MAKTNKQTTVEKQPVTVEPVSVNPVQVPAEMQAIDPTASTQTEPVTIPNAEYQAGLNQNTEKPDYITFDNESYNVNPQTQEQITHFQNVLNQAGANIPVTGQLDENTTNAWNANKDKLQGVFEQNSWYKKPVQQNTVQLTPEEQQAIFDQTAGHNTPGMVATDFNKDVPIIATDKAVSDNLPLQISANGEIYFLQKDKRDNNQRAAIAKFLNKATGSKIPETGDPNTEEEITRIYNANVANMGNLLAQQGYITTKPKKIEQQLEEAKKAGKSWLQIYNESIQPPVYDRPRADRIQQNKNMSVLADILKLAGEGVTTSQGGVPIVRQQVAPVLNAELQRLNDLYKNEYKTYKEGRLKSAMMDEQSTRQETAQEKARKAALQALLIKESGDNARFTANQAFKEKELAYKQRNDKTRNDIAMYNATHKGTGGRSGGTTGSATSGGKQYDIIINGKPVKVPIAYINDVSSKAKSKADVTDPTQNMQPAEVFASNWQNYYDYKNGEFVPKQAPKPYQLKPGEWRGADGKVYKRVNKNQPQQNTKQAPTQTKSDPLGLGL